MLTSLMSSGYVDETLGSRMDGVNTFGEQSVKCGMTHRMSESTRSCFMSCEENNIVLASAVPC